MSKRFALLAGINDYGDHSGLEPLRFAEADARLMAATLREDCGFEVEALLGDEASVERITRALRSQYNQDLELFLFFFAGHGEFLREVGMHCLHCYGSEAGDTIGTLNLGEWAARIRNNVPAQSTVMVVDACRNKVYRGSQVRGNAPGLEASVYTALKGVADTRDIRPAAGAVVPRRPRPMYTLLGCSAGQVSYEDSELGHGVFTHALVEEIRADNATLSLGQLRRRVGDRTYEWCLARRLSPEQVPEWIEPSLSGDVWLGRPPMPEPPPPVRRTEPAPAPAPSPVPAPAPVLVTPPVAHTQPEPRPPLPAAFAPQPPRAIPVPTAPVTPTAPASAGSRVMVGRALAVLLTVVLSFVLTGLVSTGLNLGDRRNFQEGIAAWLVMMVVPALVYGPVSYWLGSRPAWLVLLACLAGGLFDGVLVANDGFPAGLIWFFGWRVALACWIFLARVPWFRVAEAGRLPLWCYFFDDSRILAAKHRGYRPSAGLRLDWRLGLAPQAFSGERPPAAAAAEAAGRVTLGRTLAALVFAIGSAAVSQILSAAIIQFQREYGLARNIVSVLLFPVAGILCAVVAFLFGSRSWVVAFLAGSGVSYLVGTLETMFGHGTYALATIVSIATRAGVFAWILARRAPGFRAAAAGPLPLWCYFFDDGRILAAKDRGYRPSLMHR